MANKKCEKCGSSFKTEVEDALLCPQCVGQSNKSSRLKKNREKPDSKRSSRSAENDLLPPAVRSPDTGSKQSESSLAEPPLVKPPVAPPVAERQPPIATSSKDPRMTRPQREKNRGSKSEGGRKPSKEHGKRGSRDDTSQAEEESDHSLLPPVAGRSGKTQGSTGTQSTGSLLPGKSKSEAEPRDLLPESSPSTTDGELLPPNASRTNVDPVHVAEGAVAKADYPFGQNGISESEKVVLPDGKGGFVEVSERKTTVDYRGAKIELNRMKREEKAASQAITNFIVIAFCVLLLIGLMLFLNWYGGLE